MDPQDCACTNGLGIPVYLSIYKLFFECNLSVNLNTIILDTRSVSIGNLKYPPILLTQVIYRVFPH